MNKSDTLTKLAPALFAAQSTMAGAVKGANNPFFKSKYANLEEVIRVVKDAFSENGLSFVQFPVSKEGYAGVETIIMHTSGEFISNEFLLKCAKSDPQGMGSAITYARRYGLQAACGIPSEDDDGNEASKPPKPADILNDVSQATTIEALTSLWASLTKDLQSRTDIKESFSNRKNELKK